MGISEKFNDCAQIEIFPGIPPEVIVKKHSGNIWDWILEF